jgi:DNA-binding cell septation regulator SpoVG
MFSYDAKVFVLPNPLKLGKSTVLARAAVVIDGTVELPDFRIMDTNGQKWVASPSQKGSKPKEDGTFPYFDTVRFIDARAEGERHSPVQKEIIEFLLHKYTEAVSGKGQAAKARHQDQAKTVKKTETPASVMSNSDFDDPTW